MAARKLQQEVDRCFKKVSEGIAEFDEIYEKIEQSNNQAQKEKLEDNLKREIKKLQRLRDQIKAWAQSNDIKDKGPLMDQRKLIETRMEKFKAVEKLMKTKAFSKEGLSAAATLDPKERAKTEASDFLGTQIEELEQRIEALEAEREALQTSKKGKKSKDNAARMTSIEEVIEKHKWHQGKLELIRRSLVNGGVEAEQVNDIKDAIQYYVQEGESGDYVEDDTMYDELHLEEEEDQFGMVLENDKVSSQDTQSLQDDTPDGDGRSSSAATRGKERASIDAPSTSVPTRKGPSQLKSPLPTLATLHTPALPTATSSGPAANPPTMKPAAVPTRPPGEGLKYASAAAAAADKNNVGIAPLPPPQSAHPAVGIANQSKASSTSSPSISSIQMSGQPPQPAEPRGLPAATSAPSGAPTPVSSTPKQESLRPATSRAAGKAPVAPSPSEAPKGKVLRDTFEVGCANMIQTAHANGVTNGVKPADPDNEESIYHLPASLNDLVESWETTKANAKAPFSLTTQRLVAASRESAPDVADAEPTRQHQPESWWDTSVTWPKESLPLIDAQALYSSAKVENDTLFYAFYYKQGTHQQYLAAKALKDQAWRFHKQYQTWFQRHEEPKNITEEFEQGTYRFFDYESTWCVNPILLRLPFFAFVTRLAFIHIKICLYRLFFPGPRLMLIGSPPTG